MRRSIKRDSLYWRVLINTCLPELIIIAGVILVSLTYMAIERSITRFTALSDGLSAIQLDIKDSREH